MVMDGHFAGALIHGAAFWVGETGLYSFTFNRLCTLYDMDESEDKFELLKVAALKSVDILDLMTSVSSAQLSPLAIIMISWSYI